MQAKKRVVAPEVAGSSPVTHPSLEDADVVIYPNVGYTYVFDVKRKEELFKAGVDAARNALPRIRALLEE